MTGCRFDLHLDLRGRLIACFMFWFLLGLIVCRFELILRVFLNC